MFVCFYVYMYYVHNVCKYVRVCTCVWGGGEYNIETGCINIT